MSIINSRIKDETPNKKFQNININQEYQEIRDDRVLNFIDLSKTQKYNKRTKKYILERTKGVIFTPLLVTTKGVCKIPAVIAQSMYDSRINDYAKGVNEIKVIDTQSKKNRQDNLESQAKALVKKLYYREMKSSNPQDFVELFSYPLQTYYHKKNVTAKDIIRDKADYFKKWTKRDYSNIKLDTLNIDKIHKRVTIKITFDYILKNSKKELKGTSHHLVTMQEINGKLLIVEVGVAK